MAAITTMFDMFIGQHLASSQPLGIASMLVEQYAARQNAETQADSSHTSQSLNEADKSAAGQPPEPVSIIA